VDDIRQAYQKAVSALEKDGIIVIFGSLYLASDMRQIVLDTK
jgi:folylpolyglutamate synthase/dihydropteroate synthase